MLRGESWYYLTLSLVLCAAELIFPGNFYLFCLGIAAVFCGAIIYFFPEVYQLILVLGSGIIAIGVAELLRQWGRSHRSSREGHLNNRLAQMIGTTFTLKEPLIGGHGTVQIGDTFWTIHGPDLDAGTLVQVVSFQGMALVIAPHDSSSLPSTSKA